jgi:hypothetical protein
MKLRNRGDRRKAAENVVRSATQRRRRSLGSQRRERPDQYPVDRATADSKARAQAGDPNGS